MKTLLDEYLDKCAEHFTDAFLNEYSIMGLGDAVELLTGESNDGYALSAFVVTSGGVDSIGSPYGAAAIFRDDVQEKLVWLFEGDFFILPSSVHEVIVMKYDPTRTAELTEIVRNVNKSEVAPDDFLSDELYVYSSEKKRIVHSSEV